MTVCFLRSTVMKRVSYIVDIQVSYLQRAYLF